jgi:hypothetical protein
VPAPAPRPAGPPRQRRPRAVQGGSATARNVLQSVDSAVKALPFAHVAFNVPESLHLRNVTEIELVLSPTRSVRQLQKSVSAVGRKEGATIKVAPLMEAHLTGLGFKIESTTPARQPISSQGVTKWSWDIEATDTGTQHLHLTLDAIIRVQGENTLWPVRTFDRTLTIRVTWYDQVSSLVSTNWQWAWGAILAPLAALLVRNFRRR